MDIFFTLKLNHMFKKFVVCATMLGVVAIALASTGGGKKKSISPSPAFTPLRSAGVFTLKSKPGYSGSLVVRTENHKNITYKSLVTYQAGNTIYIVPNQYKMNSQSKLCFKSNVSRSNLNLVDLKLRLCK
jgi:hypothetical protein